MHLHLSKLNPKSQQSYHLHIALNMLTDIIRLFDGELYLLENADVVFLRKGATTRQLQEIILAAVETLGPKRLVFTHCSNQEVIEYG